MLNFRSAGESHGPCVVAVLEGLPAGLRLDVRAIDRELQRRQKGFGRGGRMRIEKDHVEVQGGVVGGRTNGAPLLLRIPNADDTMARKPPIRRPRPGHADLAGAMKFQVHDARPILERASARETCARVAAGEVVRQLLARFGITVVAWVETIGEVAAPTLPAPEPESILRRRRRNDLWAVDPAAAREMKEAIKAAARAGDTLGGTFRVLATGLPPGLGSYAQWTERLDGRLAQALMSIPAIKGVEVGAGFGAAALPGSKVHDEIHWKKGAGPFGGMVRTSNRAGGLEGGVTNGMPLDVRAAMKPISTLRQPLASVDLRTRKTALASFERSDICAVPAASVVGEAMVLLVLGQAFLDRFAADNLEELDRSFATFRELLTDRY